MKIAAIGVGNLGLSIAKGLLPNDTSSSLSSTKQNVEAYRKVLIIHAF